VPTTRLLLDTNLLFSFLLAPPGKDSPVVKSIPIALQERFEWLVPFEQLLELEHARLNDQYLNSRTPDTVWDDFLVRIQQYATVLQKQSRPFPKRVRDETDDYLIAIAIWEDVDIVVSGDKDLLALRDLLERPRIMAPAEFLNEFGSPS
jgi:putative PIN family toxin of toxin-antitoxin system